MNPHYVNCYFCPSIPQASDWHDTDAIPATVGVISRSGQNHKEGWGIHPACINLRRHCLQAPCAFLDELVTAELNLNQPILSISLMYDGITLLSILIPVMVNLAA